MNAPSLSECRDVLPEGSRVCIVANGPSSLEWQAPEGMLVCGVNRAYRYTRTDFDVVADAPTWSEDQLWERSKWVFAPGIAPKHPKLTPYVPKRGNGWFWSWELHENEPIFVGFSLFLAAQIVCWMGAAEIVFVGWDLSVGDHSIPGRQFAEEARERQLQGAGFMAASLQEFETPVRAAVRGQPGVHWCKVFPVGASPELWRKGLEPS